MTYDSENDSLDIDRLYELFIDNIIYETHVTDKLDENQYNNLTKYLYRIYRNTIDIVNREKGLDKWDAFIYEKTKFEIFKIFIDIYSSNLLSNDQKINFETYIRGIAIWSWYPEINDFFNHFKMKEDESVVNYAKYVEQFFQDITESIFESEKKEGIVFLPDSESLLNYYNNFNLCFKSVAYELIQSEVPASFYKTIDKKIIKNKDEFDRWDCEDFLEGYHSEQTYHLHKLLSLLRITNYPKMKLRKGNDLFKFTIDDSMHEKFDVRDKPKGIESKAILFDNL